MATAEPYTLKPYIFDVERTHDELGKVGINSQVFLAQV